MLAKRQMFTSRGLPSLSACVRDDVFLGRGNRLRQNGLRPLSNVGISSGFPRRPPGRRCCAIRANSSSELEDGQIEGVRTWISRFLFLAASPSLPCPVPSVSSSPHSFICACSCLCVCVPVCRCVHFLASPTRAVNRQSLI